MATDPTRPLPDWTRQDGRDCEACEHAETVDLYGHTLLRCIKTDRAAAVARLPQGACKPAGIDFSAKR